MAGNLKSKACCPDDPFPLPGDPQIEVLDGEPGLIPHILALLPEGNNADSHDLVNASRSVGRWLQVNKQNKNLDSDVLWKTLMGHFFPRAPAPPPARTMTTRECFIEMVQRHRNFAAATLRVFGLVGGFVGATFNEREATRVFDAFVEERWRNGSDNTLYMDEFSRLGTKMRRARRTKWEIHQSLMGAKFEMRSMELLLESWDPATPAPLPKSISRQNATLYE